MITTHGAFVLQVNMDTQAGERAKLAQQRRIRELEDRLLLAQKEIEQLKARQLRLEEVEEQNVSLQAEVRDHALCGPRIQQLELQLEQTQKVSWKFGWVKTASIDQYVHIMFCLLYTAHVF